MPYLSVTSSSLITRKLKNSYVLFSPFLWLVRILSSQHMQKCNYTHESNPIEHIWDEMGRAIASMDNPPQNLGELHQALLNEWAEIIVERLQRLVASMPRRLAAIIAARGENTRYRSSIHKTTPTCSSKQNNQVCWTRFTTITIQWHSGMFMYPISSILLNVITNLPKYTLNKIVHTIYKSCQPGAYVTNAKRLLTKSF